MKVVFMEDLAKFVLNRGESVVSVGKKVDFLVKKFMVHDCSTVEKTPYNTKKTLRNLYIKYIQLFTLIHKFTCFFI